MAGDPRNEGHEEDANHDGATPVAAHQQDHDAAALEKEEGRGRAEHGAWITLSVCMPFSALPASDCVLCARAPCTRVCRAATY